MKINLQELLTNQLIAKIKPDKKQAESLLKTAKDNLKAAEDNFKIKHFDWALAISYNAMLSAGRALMFFKGYRAFSEAHHLAIVKFCTALMISDSTQLVTMFNHYRTRRHNVIYGEVKSVGEDEAKQAIENAKKFVEKIKKLIS